MASEQSNLDAGMGPARPAGAHFKPAENDGSLPVLSAGDAENPGPSPVLDVSPEHTGPMPAFDPDRTGPLPAVQDPGSTGDLDEAAKRAMDQARSQAQKARAAHTRRRVLVGAAGALALIAVAAAARRIVPSIARDLAAATAGKSKAASVEAVVSVTNAQGEEERLQPGQAVVGDTATSLPRVIRAHNASDRAAWARLRVMLFHTDTAGARRDVTAYATLTGGDQAWQRAADGYWYLAQALQPGETSPALCASLQVDALSIVGLYGDGAYSLSVTAQGVTAQDNGKTAQQATGWPTE